MTPEQKRQSLQKPTRRKKGQKSSGKPLSALEKKKRNVGSTYWKNKADKAWGEYQHKRVRSCAICGRSDVKLDAHHLISRSKVMTRHAPENGIILCSYHHLRDPHNSPHAGPLGFSKWLEKELSWKYDWVFDNYHKIGKPNYKENYELLTELLEDYK